MVHPQAPVSAKLMDPLSDGGEMSTTRPGADAAAIESEHEQPLYRQLYRRLRDAILSGTMGPGQRLASSRALASQLGLARNTVLQAYLQLEVEGYLQARRGSGHYVSPLLPRRPASSARHETVNGGAGPARVAQVRNRFEFVPESLRRQIPAVPFRINQPELDAFPIDTWARLQNAVLREATRSSTVASLLGEADPQGEMSLRRAIADHVSIARGVRCSPDVIVITAGAQHAMDMLLRVLTQPGDAVGLEDPCFPGALSATRAAGCRVVPVPVDSQGPALSPALAASAGMRVLMVCPSKQFPLGITMSLPRRLALIQWARRGGAWIVEDDYDSEYRFDGKPIPSLQGLDGGRNVIYVGTFSKVLFPSLRLGFIVCPPPLVEPLAAVRAVSGRHGSTLEQRVLARFIGDGYLARHIRRMRGLYGERQKVLLEACGRRLAGRLKVETAQSGLQTVAWLPRRLDDRRLALLAQERGLVAAPLSRFCLTARRPPALVLGFGGFDAHRLRAAVAQLATLDGLRATDG
ncbi:MAG: PLP-dependent aminotransferase family protein [Lautropia sp.]